MIEFGTLSATGRVLQLPGAHDALSAHLIEKAGFAAYGIGGAALSATQIALPDIGLQSFGEYRDAVGRVMDGSRLPVMVDGENGFGDTMATVRTVRSFERMGVSAIAFEDLVLPPRMGHPPEVIAREAMIAKLKAALDARSDEKFQIVGRTDAAYAISPEEAISRAVDYAALGVNAIIVPGLPDADSYNKLRDALAIPIIAVIVPGTPWYAPEPDELASIGIEAAVYPAAILSRIITGTQEGLQAISTANGAPPAGFDMRSLAQLLDLDEWAAIDQRQG